jgi:hypothetical protein
MSKYQAHKKTSASKKLLQVKVTTFNHHSELTKCIIIMSSISIVTVTIVLQLALVLCLNKNCRTYKKQSIAYNGSNSVR